jgi:hypothetical protein
MRYFRKNIADHRCQITHADAGETFILFIGGSNSKAIVAVASAEQPMADVMDNEIVCRDATILQFGDPLFQEVPYIPKLIACGAAFVEEGSYILFGHTHCGGKVFTELLRGVIEGRAVSEPRCVSIDTRPEEQCKRLTGCWLNVSHSLFPQYGELLRA